MNFKTLIGMWTLLSLVLSACAPAVNAEAENQPLNVVPSSTVQNEAVSSATAQVEESSHSELDLHNIPVGDGKVSTQPQVGYVYSCQTSFNGGGAFASGDWLHTDGTYDPSTKPVVDGAVTWPSSFTITVQGDSRVITGNDLPDHPTGTYPVAQSDDVYNYDRNPNSITAQNFTFTLPTNPVMAASASCVPMGVVGVMLTGGYIFNALDAEGRDAPAHELLDNCQGHPEMNGAYHYHTLTDCVEDDGAGHSALVAYALDGFGIFGYRGEDGTDMTTAELDECHGHTHEITWDEQQTGMYHYHMTHEYPYTVGCFRGAPVSTGNDPQGGGQQNGQGQPAQVPAGGRGQAPQAAIDACLNLTANSACSFTGMNGTVSGACGTPPNSTQLVCMPAGAPPNP